MPQTRFRSRSSSTTSTSTSSSRISASSESYDSDDDEIDEAQLQFEESLRQLQSLVNLVLVPWVSRYFGRKWSYYRERFSSFPSNRERGGVDDFVTPELNSIRKVPRGWIGQEIFRGQNCRDLVSRKRLAVTRYRYIGR
jgi:hypothetical protein